MDLTISIIVIVGVFLSSLACWSTIQQEKISRQMQAIAEEQHRFFLLERRHQFYDVMMRFVFEVFTHGIPPTESIGWNFLHQKRQAKWIFNDESQIIADEIMGKYTQISILIGSNDDSRADQIKELKQWFGGEYYRTLPEYFEKFLQ